MSRQQSNRNGHSPYGVGATVLGGVGMGAALMYLFDADKGRARRERLASLASDTVEHSGQYAAAAWDGVSHAARSAAEAAKGFGGKFKAGLECGAGHLSSARESVADAGASLGRRISKRTSAAVKSARGASEGVVDHVRGWFGEEPKSMWGEMLEPVHSIGIPAGLLAAAGAMFFLDPTSGARRRSFIKDRFVRIVNSTGHCIDACAKDLWNRTRGIISEARSHLFGGKVPDETLDQRIHAKLGHLTTEAWAIDVRVFDGVVTLSGRVSSEEAARIAEYVESMRGVNQVVDRFEIIPGAAPHGPKSANPDSGWKPAARAASGVFGGALAVYGVIRRDLIGVGIGAVGLGCLARASAKPVMHMMHGDKDLLREKAEESEGRLRPFPNALSDSEPQNGAANSASDMTVTPL